MKELTCNELKQVNGGLAPVALFVARVAIGWASSAFTNKAY